MIDLAEQIIAKTQNSSPDYGIPQGYRLDDMGYLVDKDIQDNKEMAAKYALYRILRLHPRIFKKGGLLFNDFKVVSNSTSSIAKLFDCPFIHLNVPQSAWVYNRLYELAPEMSDRYIQVSKTMAWDTQKLRLIRSGEVK